ncbi:response regulator [Haliovirga abyssi]|uniref:Response regulator n=1 Tax=Haliovirga abyssi TaxID=2996794 RepID=A0AAU9DBX2_9FUSO|nr:response regulator [Haliovirga abyssi]BDU49628.1 response regulator [Haliovirga abyssi]
MDEKIGVKENGIPYKILIVDDSPLIHKMIKKGLLPLGFEVVGDAKNGKEGVELYKKLNPDLVTMDVTMPIMDGVAASEEIMKINPNANILMLSAMGDNDIKKQAEEKGVRNFITKPFKKENLAKSVMDTLGMA